MDSKDCLKEIHPVVTIRDLTVLLETELQLAAANGSPIPSIGGVNLRFGLMSGTEEVSVPFLVTSDTLDTLDTL